ncbi:metallophosphoesterase family protein [Deinococcus yavapaiensis]|uniref:Putative phosphodiesterase n=1 Tax=Deinococcus yavapaiensis KR-236 TaxID=694435 RepID=A0A318SGK0_9DEIO|nr:metallophosphoesterase [Deinococcus yavapaiensis]PYE56235.1 putative phosphodiesterase [Deinococcus yavapaiensis KR-236]
MRLAILADIHGNMPALQAVLADMARLGVDRVIVNGDVVNRGPDGVEVLEALLALDVEFTLGNHDDLMRLWWNRRPEIPPSWFHEAFFDSFTWCASQLHAAGLLDVFASWPMTASVAIDGAPSVTISHGTPDHYREGIGRRMTEGRLRAIFEATGADVLVGSHTHLPFETRVDGKLAVNTGAVGAPFNRDVRAQYLVLTLTNDGWQPEVRFVSYDVSVILRRYETSGLLQGGNLSALLFREELRVAYPIYARFWEWTERSERPRDWTSWREFERDVLPTFELTSLV